MYRISLFPLCFVLSGSFVLAQNRTTPIAAPAASCCSQRPMTMAFTGGNAPGLGAETTPSTADIAVVVSETGVERTPDGNWSFQVAVANDNGNNCTPSDNSRAVLLLPPDCQVVAVTAKRADGTDASWTQCGAYIEVQVGELCPANNAIGKPAIITVLLKPSPYKGSACIPAFGALVFSGRPDHVPGNNAWWWREHCTDGMTSFPQEQPLPSRGR